MAGKFPTTAKHYYNRSVAFIKRRPLASFLLALGILLLLLILAKAIPQNNQEKEPVKASKAVSVYNIGSGPKATYQGRVDKTGVITIVAQTPGIVSTVSFKEGDRVWQGQQIISLASNYQGGNAASLQRQIAQKQYQNVVDTFGAQNSLIQNQRDVATASAENAQRTRDITRQSLGETSNLINANQDQLDQINEALDALEVAPGGAADPQAGELEASALQGLNQLRSAQRTSEYQASNENPPAIIERAQREATLRQLDVQQEGLELNRDVTKLQKQLAAVNEAMMYPASPFTGTIENIAVREGQFVNAGTELATIAADDIESTITLLVPQPVAAMLSTDEPSTIDHNGKKISIKPYYVSQEATSGELYTVKYEIPTEHQDMFINGEYVSIQVSLASPEETTATPMIPIDAVYQTQEKAYVLVVNKNKAVTRDVKVGEVFGNYVAVESGLKRGDQVILNRNVIAEDSIKVQ